MLGSEIQTLVSSIGWALIHFLWQGTLITLVYWTITRNIQSIHAKYWTGMLLVVISLLIPIINSNTIAPSISISESITPLSSAIISPQQLSFEGLMYFLINASLPYVVLIWSFTVVFLSIRLIRSWMQLANIKHEGAPQVSSELKQYIKNIAIKLDLHTIPLLKISRQVMVPAAYGVLKPTILLPVSLISQIPKDQLEAIIKHELCHLKRNDFIHNIIQLCADILLFFHPGIRWMNNDIRHIREQCCDQMVLEQDTERLTYAKALTNIAAFTNDIKLKHSVHLGINDGMLLNRVKFLLQNKSSQSSLMVFLPFLMIILFLIVLLRPNHTDHNSMNTVNTVGDFQSINQVNNVEEPGNKKLLDYKSFYPKLPVQIEKKPEPIQVDQVNNASAEITQENIIDRPVITSQIAVIDKSELFDDLNKEMQLSNT
ncbi:MAG: M56 family metallopeptidase, partial [Marinicella sp.]